MRDQGKPLLLTWRWAPCAALVLSSLSFVGFITLLVPDQIGEVSPRGSYPARLSNQLSRTQLPVDGPMEAASESGSEITPAPAPPPVTRVADHEGNPVPRRGFTPPLERPAPPPAVAMPALANPPVPTPEAAPAPPPPPPPPTPEATPPAPEAVAIQPDTPAGSVVTPSVQ